MALRQMHFIATDAQGRLVFCACGETRALLDHAKTMLSPPEHPQVWEGDYS